MKVPPFLSKSKKDKIFEADEYYRDLDTAFAKVRETLQKSQERQKKAADRHRRDSKLKENDWVLLLFEKARLRKKKGKERLFPKLSMQYYGPFQITERITDVSFRLRLPDTWKIHNAFHVSLLKPFKGDVLDDGKPDEQPEVEENEKILVPEQILAHKDTKNKGDLVHPCDLAGKLAGSVSFALKTGVRGAIVTAFIICYAFTSFIAGYVSGGLYSRNDGKYWIKSMLLTASLFPFLCFSIGFALNIIAIFYRSLAAIPFGTMVVVFVIWAFISFPLALLGTVIGRNWSGAPDNPCRVKTIPRPIPEKKWYLTPFIISLMGGLLPFGSIFIEMYFVFTSFWNYKVYYVYGFMLLVFVILLIVTVCVTIVGTYFLLNAENYHWQWTSFFSAASTSAYVYLYSIYYYYMKTKMSGFFQMSFYFGYTLMFCLGLGILCGAVGYLGSSMFVRRIYRNIKCD
ncbi:hypothetical protein L7F22_056037 [Adiantum nelumboides]|nr:hypothetical protein [Adiantum nelumboides]